jgi:endo-alpha-1,4-polygalactosaminidase (GH114 family)
MSMLPDVVAHELAHQWFGNYTTMAWWDNLWLNEGFATFVGTMAVHHLFPEWDMFTQVVHSSFKNKTIRAFLKESLCTQTSAAESPVGYVACGVFHHHHWGASWLASIPIHSVSS